MSSRHYAIFDFDGTIFNGDSLKAFSVFSRGWVQVTRSVIRTSPYLIGFALSLISNHKAKELLFASLFANMKYDDFCSLGEKFVSVIEKKSIPQTIDHINRLQSLGYKIIIASASCEEWIAPWANKNGITTVIATRPQVVNDHLTGFFDSPNCHGNEKVRRIVEKFPDIVNNYIEVFTDSIKADAPLISLSCRHYIIKS